MEKVWLGLGSNLGNSQYILRQAWETLGRNPDVFLVALSSPYISEPMGMESENIFLNAVGIFETGLDPFSLLGLLQQVEKRFGRNQKTGRTGYQDRLLDLDILSFGNLQSSSSKLQLPHPQIANRLFVLSPLVEVDPQYRDPCTKKTAVEIHRTLMLSIKNGCTAPQGIERSSWDRRKVKT